MNKRIWIINQAAGMEDSGWGERHFYLARELSKQGYQITIFAGSSNHLFINENIFSGRYKRINIENFDFVWVKTPSFKKSRSLKRVHSWFIFAINMLLISRKFEKPDIILYSSSPLIPVLSAVFLKAKYKSRLIFELRDIWPMSINQLGKFKWYHPFNLIHVPLEKFAYRKADYLVATMKYADRHIKEVIRREFKFEWMPNGISSNNSVSINSETKAIIDRIPPGKVIIGYLGTFGIANAMSNLLEIAGQLKNENIHFVLVGDGPEKEKLEILAQQKQLNNTSFFNKIPKDQVKFIINKISFGIISWNSLDVYNFGVSANKYFDYMKYSLPIISIGKIEGDPVSEGNCGIKITTNDSKEIAESIIEFINKPKEELKQLGQNGHDFCFQNYTYKVISQKFDKLLSEL